MSRTDHARRPKVRGHNTSVHHVRMYDATTADQSVCSCGLRGPLRSSWHEANNDGRDHHRAVHDAQRSLT